MVISAEQFKQKANRVILIPGFSSSDEPIEIKVKSISIMGLISNKKIPNPLMPAVEKLFKIGANSTNIAEVEKTTEDNILELTELLAFICEKTMVEPTYDEIGEYLTEDQMLAIFEMTQNTVNQLIPSNNK